MKLEAQSTTLDQQSPMETETKESSGQKSDSLEAQSERLDEKLSDETKGRSGHNFEAELEMQSERSGEDLSLGPKEGSGQKTKAELEEQIERLDQQSSAETKGASSQEEKWSTRPWIHALKATFCAILAGSIVFFDEAKDVMTGLPWAVITVCVVFTSGETVGAIHSKGMNRIIGTTVAALIAAAVGVIIAILPRIFEIAAVLVVVGFTTLVISFTTVGPGKSSPYLYSYQLGLLTFNFLLLEVIMDEGNPDKALSRAAMIGIWASLAIVVNLTVFPAFAHIDLEHLLKENIADASSFLKETTESYLEGVVRSPLSSDRPLDDPSASEGREALQRVITSRDKARSLIQACKWEPQRKSFVDCEAVDNFLLQLRRIMYNSHSMEDALRCKYQPHKSDVNVFAPSVRRLSISMSLIIEAIGACNQTRHYNELSYLVADMEQAAVVVAVRLAEYNAPTHIHPKENETRPGEKLELDTTAESNNLIAGKYTQIDNPTLVYLLSRATLTRFVVIMLDLVPMIKGLATCSKPFFKNCPSEEGSSTSGATWEAHQKGTHAHEPRLGVHV